MIRIMKYFIVLAFLLIAGCSIFPYGAGGEYYVAPGTFTGRWVITRFDSSGAIGDTNLCTAVITEGDENLAGTITNDSTKEVLTLTGIHSTFSTADGVKALHSYVVTEKSSIGDSDVNTTFFFSPSGDTLEYFGARALPRFPSLKIFCIRN
jgi:hypothetical protein